MEAFDEALEERKRELPFGMAEAHTAKRQNKKIGRNDPCPCGSGKKYKKCCLDSRVYENYEVEVHIVPKRRYR
jgi:hypothetical protein